MIFRLAAGPYPYPLLFGTGEYDWLSTHSPFDAADDRLRSISFGITVPDNNHLINCDNAEGIREAILKGLDGTYIQQKLNIS